MRFSFGVQKKKKTKKIEILRQEKENLKTQMGIKILDLEQENINMKERNLKLEQDLIIKNKAFVQMEIRNKVCVQF